MGLQNCLITTIMNFNIYHPHLAYNITLSFIQWVMEPAINKVINCANWSSCESAWISVWNKIQTGEDWTINHIPHLVDLYQLRSTHGNTYILCHKQYKRFRFPSFCCDCVISPLRRHKTYVPALTSMWYGDIFPQIWHVHPRQRCIFYHQ